MRTIFGAETIWDVRGGVAGKPDTLLGTAADRSRVRRTLGTPEMRTAAEPQHAADQRHSHGAKERVHYFPSANGDWFVRTKRIAPNLFRVWRTRRPPVSFSEFTSRAGGAEPTTSVHSARTAARSNATLALMPEHVSLARLAAPPPPPCRESAQFSQLRAR